MAALGYKNVGGLDIAMDDALGVRGVEAFGNIDADFKQTLHFESATGDQVLER